MLKLAVIERSLYLKHQLRLAKRSKPKANLLHLRLPGKPSDPGKAIQEKAFLMQLRLHLEAQLETGSHR